MIGMKTKQNHSRVSEDDSVAARTHALQSPTRAARFAAP
jgi:hypothetical protein